MATALYRRYRPDSFAEVIGQEHVTDPLRAALRSGRIGQAYLFSGPRGCGKTTSARILARCLNCAQGPTDTPCGTCDSCVELARGGPGSLDVVEIDAASHGGVDDARELRERATFAPARDRQKVFIIDEAHMVTPQGFNALLKIVEEPPPHIAFIFATTEPDKVLGTIRSRTHHYPFRLVPPQVLQAHLQQVCEAEGVQVGQGVLPLVVRAGAGSVRDSLSVLDQLAAGAGPAGIDYEHAVGLLGYTHATLLDDVTAAFAAGDGATVFQVVDRVISSGQDPRRFVDDLLQRLRDLVVVQAVGDRAAQVFPGVPSDQLERMAVQAAGFGAAQLSRAADLANTASTEMTGATSPRLHLELLCARMLLPAADDGERGLAARLDRVERRLAVPGGVPAAGGASPAEHEGAARALHPVAADLPGEPPPGDDGEPRGARHVRDLIARRRDGGVPAPVPAAQPAGPPAERHERAEGQDRSAAPAVPAPSQAAPPSDPRPPAAAPTAADPREWPDDGPAAPSAAAPAAEAGPAAPPAREEAVPAATGRAGQDSADEPSQPSEAATPVAVSPDPVGAVPTGGPAGAHSTEAVRRMWPEVLDHLASVKRRTWTRVSQDAQVVHVDDQRVVLQFARPNTLQAFSIGPHADFVREALIAVIGLDRQVVATNAGAPVPGASSAPAGGRAAPVAPAPAPVAAPPAERPTAPAPAGAERPAAPSGAARPGHGTAAPPADADEPVRHRDSAPRDDARGSATPRGAGRPDQAPPPARRQRSAAPPPWEDAPPPEPPDDGEPPPPEDDDPWADAGQLSRQRPAAPAAPSSSGEPRAAATPPPAPERGPAPSTAPAGGAAPTARPAARPAAQPTPQPSHQPAQRAGAAGRPLSGADLARSAMRSAAAAGGAVSGDGGGAGSTAGRGPLAPEDEPSRDDPDAEGSGQVGLPVVQRLLGGRVLSVDERR
ncbi:DNA polymerase III subunit gamma and tau [Quadrisphaera setariae]|uniref:DNA-directed DNA polymerase n=1 Tax=Quadrisphaera setariae TaxID=2593304 RepID=A0A5C8ZCH7_9ACTN|nr:DNA polymerase III subunit gamma and tau [Quadrisphaera setariae]TXR55144.1 DNA polymerase III subunit gamma and tau [Quadrisphaera setariae]